jgi:hypothetical protein
VGTPVVEDIGAEVKSRFTGRKRRLHMAPRTQADTGATPDHLRSKAEHYAAGKALRDTCPRASHAPLRS